MQASIIDLSLTDGMCYSITFTVILLAAEVISGGAAPCAELSVVANYHYIIDNIPPPPSVEKGSNTHRRYIIYDYIPSHRATPANPPWVQTPRCMLQTGAHQPAPLSWPSPPLPHTLVDGRAASLCLVLACSPLYQR